MKITYLRYLILLFTLLGRVLTVKADPPIDSTKISPPSPRSWEESQMRVCLETTDPQIILQLIADSKTQEPHHLFMRAQRVYLCQALAEKNPEQCSNAQKFFSGNAEFNDRGCKRAYYSHLSLAAIIQGQPSDDLCQNMLAQDQTFPDKSIPRACQIYTLISKKRKIESGCSQLAALSNLDKDQFMEICNAHFSFLKGVVACKEITDAEERRSCQTNALIMEALISKDISRCRSSSECTALLSSSAESCRAIQMDAIKNHCEKETKHQLKETINREIDYRKQNKLAPYPKNGSFLHLLPPDARTKFEGKSQKRRAQPKDDSSGEPSADQP